ncbi:AMP-binding protein [Mycobacterium sp. C31M]
MTDDLIHDLVAAAASVAPERSAIIDVDGSSITFAQFDSQIRRLAGWVTAHSRPGDRIAVIADNSADYARLYYAVPRSGRILTLINQRLAADEQRAQLDVVRPPWSLATPATSPTCRGQRCHSTSLTHNAIRMPPPTSRYRPTPRPGCCSPAARPAPPRGCCTHIGRS